MIDKVEAARKLFEQEMKPDRLTPRELWSPSGLNGVPLHSSPQVDDEVRVSEERSAGSRVSLARAHHLQLRKSPP